MDDTFVKKLVVLGTGGTIAGLAAEVHDNVGYKAAQVGVERLLEALPQALRRRPTRGQRAGGAGRQQGHAP
jgi:L-asparaginase/Glu-tRNA(Gln) amidotransferase subunit D